MELRSPWLLAATTERAHRQLLTELYGGRAFAVTDTTATGQERRGLLGIDERYADLSIDAQARFEILGSVALVDREEGGREAIEEEGIPVVSLLTATEILG